MSSTYVSHKKWEHMCLIKFHPLGDEITELTIGSMDFTCFNQSKEGFDETKLVGKPLK